jgi:hypothetical protein
VLQVDEQVALPLAQGRDDSVGVLEQLILFPTDTGFVPGPRPPA